ncbi:TipC family immunity protein [Pueribacillus sp. YX66]|uniref:TipC family immunity protein n=1 Tax=Pueribacillus sp. YX66 TaxID=3229242 RepID=UPI00358D5BF4
MKKIIYVVISVVLLFIGGHYVYKATKVKNVFDEMYYAEFQSVPKLYTSTSYTELIKAGVLKSSQKNVRDFFPDFKSEYYDSQSLPESERMTLNFYTEENNEEYLEILAIKEYENDNDRLRFYFIYDIGKKN